MTLSEITEQLKNAEETDNVSHFIYGSIGGFLKYIEVVAKLDSMRLEYPLNFLNCIWKNQIFCKN